MDSTFFERINFINIAAEIDRKCKRLPLLPEVTPGVNYHTNCVISRTNEVLNFWKEANLHPSKVFITASAELHEKLFIPEKLQFIPVTLVVDQYLEDKVLGTFTLKVESEESKAVYIKATTGIAYVDKPSPEYHATRWILQEIDGNAPLMAHNLASKL